MRTIPPKPKSVYRILFRNHENLYELYARQVNQGRLFAFVEVEEILFGNRGGVLVDPSEERLKFEFAGVKRTFLPLQAVVRIDEVEKEGTNKIVSLDSPQGNVAQFPMPPGAFGPKPGKG
ncbi:MAG: DUF1820 family protein [Deltaproteobacteria bacterium]